LTQKASMSNIVTNSGKQEERN